MEILPAIFNFLVVISLICAVLFCALLEILARGNGADICAEGVNVPMKLSRREKEEYIQSLKRSSKTLLLHQGITLLIIAGCVFLLKLKFSLWVAVGCLIFAAFKFFRFYTFKIST